MTINVLGFIPFGAAIIWLWALSHNNHTNPINAASVASFKVIGITLLVCMLVSLFIELAQYHIPGRNSHLHDLALNVIGGCIGIVGFIATYKIKTLAASFKYFSKNS